MKRLPLFFASALLLAACTDTMPGPNTTDTGNSSSPFVVTNASWNKYTNAKLGFSMNLPSKVYVPLFSADPTTEVIALEDTANNRVFIAPKLAGSGPADETITTTLDLLKSEDPAAKPPHWEIIAKTVSNDAQLDAFIKDRYGKDCSLGGKKETSQAGVFDVAIAGQGSPEEGDCFVNYVTVIKYSPAKKRVISWHLGQAPSFMSNSDGTHVYDTDMLLSFRFE